MPSNKQSPNILFDKGGSQVQVQLETQKRLTTLFGALEAQGWTYAIGEDRITDEQLQSVKVLAILTRHVATQKGTKNPFPANWDFAFTDGELSAITNFVQRGGGLLHISNHGPFSNAPNDDWTVYDKVLAAKLGVTIEPASFMLKGANLMPMTLSTDPAITSTILKGVSAVVAHNSCAIAAMKGTPATVVASIPSNAFNDNPKSKLTPPGWNYAITLTHGKGKVIVAGNSGIAGNTDSQYPAPGLIATPDNQQFQINCLSYLGA